MTSAGVDMEKMHCGLLHYETSDDFLHSVGAWGSRTSAVQHTSMRSLHDGFYFSTSKIGGLQNLASHTDTLFHKFHINQYLKAERQNLYFVLVISMSICPACSVPCCFMIHDAWLDPPQVYVLTYFP